MISSHVKISMISLISSLSPKLYLNSLVYHRNIFGSSSRVSGNLRKSSAIFGKFRKFSENVRECSSCLRNNFGKFSEIFIKWYEIFGKSSRMPSSVLLYNKRTLQSLARRYEFYVLVARTLSHLFAALTHEILFLPLNIKFISSRHCVISSISPFWLSDQ